ncbi:MAG: gamma-glutamylcyclotransferase family protein [Acinetobacter sp.]
MEHLFVYGTLRPNETNAHLLDNIGGVWRKATLRGIVHVLDWGPDAGLFALELNDQANEVEGFVFSSNTLQHHWQMLDDFEGFQYRRVQTQACIEDNLQTVWTYVIQPRQK